MFLSGSISGGFSHWLWSVHWDGRNARHRIPPFFRSLLRLRVPRAGLDEFNGNFHSNAGWNDAGITYR